MKLDCERAAAAELGDGARLIGVDEAGRGPLAGPVVAGAVHAPLALLEELAQGAWREVNDSKKLSPKKRDRLAETIKTTPGVVWATAEASVEEIDSLNILRATHLAMRRAAGKLFDSGDAFILVDGLPVPDLPYPGRNIVKGDSKSILIAAASILAKTARDGKLMELARRYPQYSFDIHKGYPTKAHLAALAEYGPCPEHRKSFGPVKNAIAPSGDGGLQ